MLVQEEMLQDLAVGIDKLYKKVRTYFLSFRFIQLYSIIFNFCLLDCLSRHSISSIF